MAEQLTDTAPTPGCQILGFIGESGSNENFLNGSVLGNLEKLEMILSEMQVEERTLTTSALSQEQILSLSFVKYGASKKITLRLSSGLYESDHHRIAGEKELARVPLSHPIMSVNWIRFDSKKA